MREEEGDILGIDTDWVLVVSNEEACATAI